MVFRLPLREIQHITNSLNVVSAALCDTEGSFFCVLIVLREHTMKPLNSLQYYVYLFDINIWAHIGSYYLGSGESMVVRVLAFDKDGLLVNIYTQLITLGDMECVYFKPFGYMGWDSKLVKHYKNYIKELVCHYEVRTQLWALLDADSCLDDFYKVDVLMEGTWNKVQAKIKRLQSQYPIKPSQRNWVDLPVIK